MKKVLIVALLSSVAAFNSAKAENLPAPKIGVVEQAILDKSDAFKSIVEQVEKKRAEIQKELATYEKDLKAEDKKLSEEQKKLSEKEFTPKRQAFEKRVRDIQEKIEIRKLQLEIGVDEAKKKVYQTFLKVADDVKKDAGANILLYKETVITGDPSFDLTKQTLDKLNKTLPTVKVNFKSEDEIKKQLKQQIQVQPQPQQPQS